MATGRRDVRPVPQHLKSSDPILYQFLKDLWEGDSDGIPAGFTSSSPGVISGSSSADPGTEESGWPGGDHSHLLDTSGVPGDYEDSDTVGVQGAGPGASLSGHRHPILANELSLAKLAQIATARFLGRITAGTGNVEVLTGTQATTLLDVFTSLLKGLAPASGGGTTNFLRADGTWAAPGGGGGSTPDNDAQILAYAALAMRR